MDSTDQNQRSKMKGMQEFANTLAHDKGFWPSTPFPEDGLMYHLAVKISLIASEAFEALDVFRTSDDRTKLAEELADVVIRTMDVAEELDIDLESVIDAKFKKNTTRTKLHGKRF